MRKLEQLYNEWKAMQPINPEYQRRLDRKFMLDFNYNSNHLEGNTLTYGQTKLLLLFGETEGSASIRDWEEMKAHNVGLELIKREAEDTERPLTENFIRSLNRTIQVEDYRKFTPDKKCSYEIHVGVYKTRPNSVETPMGELFEYASPEETPALMHDLVAWLNEELESGKLSMAELTALFHYRYIRIHPFEDGNGRVVRLLVNYILLRRGYPMIVIQSDDRTNYLRILHQCDVNVGDNPSDGANAGIEQVEPLVKYIELLIEKALELGIKAGKGEDIEEPDDFRKELALSKKRLDGNKQKEKELEQDLLERKQELLKKGEQLVNEIISTFVLKTSKFILPAIKEFDNEGRLEYIIEYYNFNIKNIADKTGLIFEFNEDIASDTDIRIVLDGNLPSINTNMKMTCSILFEQGRISISPITLDKDEYLLLFFDAENNRQFEKSYKYEILPTEQDWNTIIKIMQDVIRSQINSKIKEE